MPGRWLLILAIAAFGCDKSRPGQVTSNGGLISTEIEPFKPPDPAMVALVNELVSANQRPVLASHRHSHTPHLKSIPDDYDDDEQARIFEVYVQLTGLGPAAYPALIAGMHGPKKDDYVCTLEYDKGDMHYNYSLMRIGQHILNQELEQPFQQYFRLAGLKEQRYDLGYVHKVIGEGEQASRWAQQHAKLSLLEVQLEVIDWMIAEYERIKPDPKSSWSIDVEGLKAKADELRASGKPAEISLDAVERSWLYKRRQELRDQKR